MYQKKVRFRDDTSPAPFANSSPKTPTPSHTQSPLGTFLGTIFRMGFFLVRLGVLFWAGLGVSGILSQMWQYQTTLLGVWAPLHVGIMRTEGAEH